MPNSLIKSFAKKSKKSEKEVEQDWQEAKAITYKNTPYRPPSASFFRYSVAVLKKILKLR